jgi:hypothetical protein
MAEILRILNRKKVLSIEDLIKENIAINVCNEAEYKLLINILKNKGIVIEKDDYNLKIYNTDLCVRTMIVFNKTGENYNTITYNERKIFKAFNYKIYKFKNIIIE